ncbi:MFS transporter, partial [Enterococcus lactis]|nr:MFS transporter [Enterococcus lactis]
GTVTCISVLANVTKANNPSSSESDMTRLAYEDQATNALVSGCLILFFVAMKYGILGFIIAFLLK